MTARSRNKVRRPRCYHHLAPPSAEFFCGMRSVRGKVANASRWNQRADCGSTTRFSGVDESRKPSHDQNRCNLDLNGFITLYLVLAQHQAPDLLVDEAR